jgi:tripartite-type tricarboxylate transporter receptor subunit TctC
MKRAAGLRRAVWQFVIAVCAFAAAGAAVAQNYPSKPIRVIVPVAPGGAADLIARTVGAGFSEGLGQPAVIENRVGAAGQIGTDAVVKAPADGYTLLVAPTGPLSIAGHFRKLPYDGIKDLAPITMLVTIPSALAVNAKLPIRSVEEFIQYAKKTPGGVLYSIAALGGNFHLSGELLGMMAGIKLTPVGYKGTSPATTAILTGEVQAGISDLVTLMPLAADGRIRILGVTDPRRSAVAPHIPTVGESGVPGYGATASAALFAPAGTPRDIIARLNAVATGVIRQPEVQKALIAAGLDPNPTTVEEITRFMKEDTEKWGKLIKDANIKIE